jgi:nucleoside-diphosphate-sugar epimerase
VSLRTGEEIRGEVRPEELLIHANRDRHPVEFVTGFLASRLIEISGNEENVRRGLRGINYLGEAVAETLGALIGSENVARGSRKLMGVVDRRSRFRFRRPTELGESEVQERIAALQADARRALKALGRKPRFRMLLTGASGFLGKELLCQAAADRRVDRVVAVLRPETIRDRRSGELLRVVEPEERGRELLRRLGIRRAAATKFQFLAGDIEKPLLGIDAGLVEELRRDLTHVVHCAASVSFDSPYDESFAANVLGCRNALEFSLGVQQAAGSRFVQHLAIETSYIHGRKKRTLAQETALEFPRYFYNNYYELTKAMASIETDRFTIEEGLRVSQLLPSIVIGQWRTGNNRGDTKVVNAPVNAFGRARVALDQARETGTTAWLRAWVVSTLAGSFPGDRSAELNLVPVDRVVAGILAALDKPESIGVRIHLATDNRIRAEDMVRLAREELGANVRLADPTL